MIGVAFYVAPGDWIDRAVRAVTRSPYSHVELVALDADGGCDPARPRRAISASWRDGGVRATTLVLGSAWEVVRVPWASAAVMSFASDAIGARYDLPGLLGAQLLGLRRAAREGWFCSELCAAALGLAEPHRYSPGALHGALADHGRTYSLGLAARRAAAAR